MRCIIPGANNELLRTWGEIDTATRENEALHKNTFCKIHFMIAFYEVLRFLHLEPFSNLSY